MQGGSLAIRALSPYARSALAAYNRRDRAGGLFASIRPAPTSPTPIMARLKALFKKVWGQLTAPKVSDEELDRCMEKVREQLPTPVFWLLGKTQSGKTSLIRSLTQNSRAEIGNGIRPCTRTAIMYPFPSEEDCILRFLDTRGLGEANYDPAEEIALFQDQAHLLIVVMKALDHAQQPVMDALKQIHRARPHWPILVVQTTLHEGYRTRDEQHLIPYPYHQTPFPPQVPPDLARSLVTQRLMFQQAGLEARFVPVDLTLQEDGYEPINYGLEQVWEAIDELLPLGLRGILEQHDQARRSLRDAHFRAAHPHIISYSVAAGAAATVPVPIVDMPLVLAIQAKMFHAIASIYHQDFDREQIGEVMGGLGLGFLGRLGGRELLKIIPAYGSAISALYAGASTYALGVTLCVYFSRKKDGNLPDQSEFREIYETHFREGRERLKAYLQSLREKKAGA
jgi:uncharacterized protein (DUF697 family)